MQKAILAKKVGMTQLFFDNGELVPITVLLAGPCYVTQIKTDETDGYNAIQVGFWDKSKNILKPLQGIFSKAGVSPKRYLREFRFAEPKDYKVGDEIKVDEFSVGEFIDATGISKGKGFQGSIKRHGHQRGPMAHGSKYHRGVGSMSSATTPGRVKKGKKMPGHMGHERITIQNLKIMRIDADKNLLFVKGSVPGPKNSLIFIKNSVKAKA